MAMAFLQVAIGGGCGAALRYGVGLLAVRTFGTGFPVGTLLVNVIGALCMGIFAHLLLNKGLSAWAPLVLSGFLGGFTTFSAFSLETLLLIERGQSLLAVIYVLCSVGLSVGALFLGMLFMRTILT